MSATFGNAIVGALARLLRLLGLGPLAGADPELPEPGWYTGFVTHEHGLPDGSGLWHRHTILELHPVRVGHRAPWAGPGPAVKSIRGLSDGMEALP